MKRTLIITTIPLFLILLIMNSIFLIEIHKDKNLNNFFYNGKDLSNDYTNKEITHMHEVKDLVKKSITFNMLLLFMLIVLKPKSKELELSGRLMLLITGFFIIFAILFENFFYYFHLVLFNSTNWLLPIDSKLIQDYPFTYFRNMFIIITILAGILSTILINNERIKRLWTL